jgi:hypothetical protein
VISYSYRPSLLAKELRYELSSRSLACSNGRVLDFADIDRIRIYDTRDVAGITGDSVRRCVIYPLHGRPIVLASVSFLGVGRFADRAENFQVFGDALIKHVAAANPRTKFIAGMPVALWWFWAFALASLALVIPLTTGSFLLSLLGDSAIATILVAVAVLAAIAVMLVNFLGSLRGDWPRTFDPRIRLANDG